MHLLLLLFSLFALLSPALSLYFYLEGSQIRCFLEDLPKDTLVVGYPLTPWYQQFRHLRAEEWDSETNSYTTQSKMGLKITVDTTYPQLRIMFDIGNIR